MKRQGKALQVYNGGRIRRAGQGFAADFCAHGERKRKRVSTVKEAKTAIDAWAIAAKNNGRAAMDITDRDLADVRDARKRLGDIRLHTVFEFWMDHHQPLVRKTVEDLVDDFLDAPGRRGGRAVQRRERTLGDHRNRLAAFVKTHGQAQVGEITTDDIVLWLEANGWQGLTRRHYIASVRALFAFAVRTKSAMVNPTVPIELPELPAAEPVIMATGDVTEYLRTVEAASPGLLVREVLSFFCGLRSNELDRLDWRNISIENRLVTITGDAAKIQGHRRNVELPDNALEWMGPHAKAEGPVSPGGEPFQKRRAAAKTAGVTVPHNAGRHAFASYHLALHQNAPLTAEALGHADVKLLRNVYRNIVAADGKPITKATAEAYFQIKPKRSLDVAKLVKMTA